MTQARGVGKIITKGGYHLRRQADGRAGGAIAAAQTPQRGRAGDRGNIGRARDHRPGGAVATRPFRVAGRSRAVQAAPRPAAHGARKAEISGALTLSAATNTAGGGAPSTSTAPIGAGEGPQKPSAVDVVERHCGWLQPKRGCRRKGLRSAEIGPPVRSSGYPLRREKSKSAACGTGLRSTPQINPKIADPQAGRRRLACAEGTHVANLVLLPAPQRKAGSFPRRRREAWVPPVVAREHRSHARQSAFSFFWQFFAGFHRSALGSGRGPSGH